MIVGVCMSLGFGLAVGFRVVDKFVSDSSSVGVLGYRQ